MQEDHTELIDAEEQELYEHFRIEVDKGQKPERLDKFLMQKMAQTSRNRIQNGIKAESILINNKPTKNNYTVKPSDLITVVLPREPKDRTLKPEPMDLDIVFEDADLMVINKPHNLVVHPGVGNWTGTLVNGLVHYFSALPNPAKSNELRPGLVHRIDKDTTGLMVVAKNDFAMTHLAKQFFDHSIERHYQALVWGDFDADEGTIDCHVDRATADRKLMGAFPKGDRGKHAITHYKVLERFGYVSLIECHLETGRTHQIRVHMQYLKQPIFNDEIYGGSRILRGSLFNKYKQFIENCREIMPRLCLHAKSLGFIHPVSGQKMYFEVPIPKDYEALLDKWRSYVSTKPIDED